MKEIICQSNTDKSVLFQLEGNEKIKFSKWHMNISSSRLWTYETVEKRLLRERFQVENTVKGIMNKWLNKLTCNLK